MLSLNLLKTTLNKLSSQLGFNIFNSITLSFILLLIMVVVDNLFLDNTYLDVKPPEDDKLVKDIIDECDNKDYI